MNRISSARVFLASLLLTASAFAADSPKVLTGQAAFTDVAHESPGTRRHLTAADLPGPAPEQSVDNGPSVVARPANGQRVRAAAGVMQFTAMLFSASSLPNDLLSAMTPALDAL